MEISIYIYSAHAIHKDVKGYSGLFLTMGKGAIINTSKKIGLAIISLMETEAVACGERFPKCMWFRYFCLA